MFRLIFLLCTWFIAFPNVISAEPPNYVVILIDDLGYGDIEPFGSTTNKTPNLNQMAKEGRTLTSFYVASPVCTASRAALMTGCYPQRVGLEKGSGHMVLFPGDSHGLHPDEITIAETLKSVGYATGCFGKWHLGDQEEFLPTSQGFDRYFGIPYSNDMWPEMTRWSFPDLPLVRGIEVVGVVKSMADQASLCRRFTEEAVQFIKEHKKGPFFVYLPHASVHRPRLASSEFMAEGKTVEQAQIEEVDWSVGEILKTLREEGLEKDTLVLFTSDNGPAKGLSAGPLRGKKGSAFEGGQREPAIVWWPGTIAGGTTSDELITAMDLHPTFAEMSGAKLPDDRVIDGKYIEPILVGDDNASTPYDRFFYQQGGEVVAVRSGDWKLYTDGRIYNLKHDIGEKEDISLYNPDISMILSGMFAEFSEDIAEFSRPVGVAKNPRTLLPRPGIEGEEGYLPTLQIDQE